LPQAVKQLEQRSVHQRQMVILGVWVLAALIGVAMVLCVGFFKKNVRLARLEKEYHEAKLEAAQVERQWQKVSDIEGMLKGRLIFSDLAKEIGRLQPSQIALVSVAISDADTLTLQGMAANPGDINQFQKGMVDSARFSNVNLDYVNKRLTQQGEIDYFKITCTIKSVSRQK
jgi:Tfp pilus assembly protein PilN